MSYSLERVFKIYDLVGHGLYEVKPDDDDLGLIEIAEFDKDMIEVGRVTFDNEVAKLILKALQETLQEETK
jgi:hypothetical protein